MSKSILTAFALLVAAAVLALAYDRVALMIAIKGGPEVILDASRGKK